MAKKKEEVNNSEIKENSISKSVNAHMEENLTNTKVYVDYKNLAMYIILIIIIGAGIFLVLNFFDKYHDGYYKKTTVPTTTRGIITTKPTTQEVYYNTTTKAPTQATHTVFDKNRR